MDFCGLLWTGPVWTVLDCCGLLRTVVDCFGLLQTLLDFCRLLWTFADCCGLLWSVADCCRLLLTFVDCCGLLWTLVHSLAQNWKTIFIYYLFTAASKTNVGLVIPFDQPDLCSFNFQGINGLHFVTSADTSLFLLICQSAREPFPVRF